MPWRLAERWGEWTACWEVSLCLSPAEASLPGSSLPGDSPGKNTGVGCADRAADKAMIKRLTGADPEAYTR